ncbi:cation channel sperm-associated auxiliary subunit delta-like isoform X3 [Apostichopus japonicus]|uniref:cation channel sperm-associated auxiliary subunit delta-like isoform X3 n=1 Tax=Stichopus japonicus TaxID=307972 RepID=UPI003AB1B34D
MHIFIVVVVISVCPIVRPSASELKFNVLLTLLDQEVSLEEDSRVPVRCDDNKGRVFHHPCREDVAIFCKDGFAYLKASSEEVLESFVFPEGFLKNKSLAVQTAAFSFCSDLLFFILQGDLFSFHYRSRNFPQVPLDVDVTNVETSCCCVEQCYDTAVDEVVVVWNGLVNTSSHQFYLSQDGGLTFNMQKIKMPAEGLIHNAHFLHSHGCIGFLVKLSSSVAQFFYHTFSHSGGIHLKGLEQTFIGSLSSVSVGAGDGEILLWDEERLRYSANGGQSFLPVYQMSSSGSEIVDNYYSSEKRPFQILSDGSDTFVVRNYEGEIFFGKAGITPSLIKPSNVSSQMNNSVVVSSEMLYPLEKYSSNCKQECSTFCLCSTGNICPYTNSEDHATFSKHQALMITQLRPVYYLDIGMTMVLDVHYLPEPWMEDEFIVSVENPSIISTHTDVTVGEAVDTGVMETNLAINISLVASGLPDGERESARGMSNIKVSVIYPNPACMAQTSKTTRIVAGCPSYKQIRVRRTVEVTECENMKYHQYTIPRDVYDRHYLQGTGPETDWGDLEVMYDYWKLGCPHPVYYGFIYKPVLELYEHDVFKEVITADFVLTEANGIYNYGYTETADTAGCKRRPQSWLLMLQQQFTVDPYTAWTRENYISCHSPEQGAESYDPSQPYEVLSNNTTNGIKFSQYNGIYVFNITVLDPDYSFCQLETQFAVEVFGAFPKSELPALRIMMITCGLGLIALISLYVIDIFYWRDGEEERVETRRDSFPY